MRAAIDARAAGGAACSASITQFYKSEGVLALFDRGSDSDMAAGGSDLTWQQQHPDGGTFAVQSGGRQGDPPGTALPQVTLAVEHYNRMVRLLDHNVPVKVELNIQTKDRAEVAATPNGFNIVGEIPGTDKADEIVLVGAHFDSWQGATGATDNAAGSAAMMEVLRILKATGLTPRRTVRIGLWGGEEEGLLGSREYVRAHLGTAQAPLPELAKTSVYFNLDNGTGPIRGIWMQGNTGVEPIFKAWTAPLKDLGVEILSPRSVTQTDHGSFDAVGVPAFQFVQERYEYNSRTHHTNMDFLDRVQPNDMKQIATVAAMFVWQAANRDAAAAAETNEMRLLRSRLLPRRRARTFAFASVLTRRRSTLPVPSVGIASIGNRLLALRDPELRQIRLAEALPQRLRRDVRLRVERDEPLAAAPRRARR